MSVVSLGEVLLRLTPPPPMLPYEVSWRTKSTRSLILLKDLRDYKRFSITLDTVYMDSCGVAIYIMYVVSPQVVKPQSDDRHFLHRNAVSTNLEVNGLCKTGKEFVGIP